MAKRMTLERILRDDDDASGQTIRSWRIESDGDQVCITKSEHSEWIMIRTSDVDQFIADLREIARAPSGGGEP